MTVDRFLGVAGHEVGHGEDVANMITMERVKTNTMKTRVIIACAIANIAACAHGQGSFQNLNFESAQLIFLQSTVYVATSNALPGWVASSGTEPLATVRCGGSSTFWPVSLLVSNTAVISGRYSAYVGGGSISQTGLVPSDARALLFTAAPSGQYSGIGVSLDGQRLSLMEVGQGLNFLWYSADVSAFAGQTATLTLSGYGAFDDIQFVVPEPSELSLILIGTGTLVWRRVRKPAIQRQ